MVVEPEYAPRVAELDEDLGALELLVVRGTPGSKDIARIATVAWQALIDDAPAAGEPGVVAEEDVAAVLYTSGTTGTSKGVVIAHRQAYTYAATIGRLLEISEEDVYYAPLPLFHIAGQWAVVYAALQAGATAVIKRKFSVTEFWPDVAEEGATVGFLLGAMANFLQRQPPSPRDADNPLERLLMFPLVEELESFRKRFGVRVCTAYGSTEVNIPIVSGFDVSDPRLAGRPAPGYELRIVDEKDEEVSVGHVGELAVRADVPWTTMVGYHANPSATSKAFRNLWLHSGDAMRRDKEGNYYFVDRLRDVIRRRGENISSHDVERAVNSFDAILESAAIGVPSHHTEEEVWVYAVPKPGRAIGQAELRNFLKECLPPFMLPEGIEIVAALPKTPNGKVRKHALRQLARRDYADVTERCNQHPSFSVDEVT